MRLQQFMEWDDFQASRKFIEEKALKLMQHESKPHARVGFPVNNYRIYQKDGRTFYYVGTNIFKGIYEQNLVLATEKYPEKFGTGNALDVVEAINLIEPLYPDVERTAELLRDEHFGLFIENNNGTIENRILRLDLFRQLDPTPTGEKEFTGGIMHALKHFSFKGVPLSTGKEIHDIPYTTKVIEILLEAFFMGSGEFTNPTTYVCYYDYNEKYNLRIVFYYEPNTDVYFLKSIYKKEKPKKTDNLY